jgi:peptidoglycan DL-endopeptidase CwlO
MFKKRLLVLNTTILLGVGSSLSIPSVYADSNSQSIQIQQAEQKIALAQTKLSQLAEQVQKVDQAMKDNTDLIVKTEKEIEATKLEIKSLEDEIKILNENIAKRNEVLKKRALSYQESGGKVSYLEVLVGSKDFGDFVDRAAAVAQIVSADNDMVKQHEIDKEEVGKKQASVDKKLTDLTSTKTELEGMKAQIQEQKQKNDELKELLKKDEQESIAKKAELQEQERISQMAALTIATAPSANSGKESASSDKKSANNITVGYDAPKNSGNISDAITAGYKYIGNSVYVFGGGRTQSDIANGRFDCSGFVHWAFAQAGINVGSSTDSLKNSGTRVSASDMQPGDLVFFNTYKTDGHVGIYVGGGKFIGSQSSTGVAVANMSSGYWAQNFNGRVVRIR